MKLQFALLAVLLLSTGLSQAAQHGSRNTLSKEEAANRVQRNYGGKVLDIRRKDNGQYRIKLLKGGRVRIINIDSGSHRGRD